MAKNPIKKSDIADFEEIQKSMNELIATLEKLAKVLHTDLKQAADDVAKSLQGVNVTTKDGQKVVQDAATAAESLSAQQKQLATLDKQVTDARAKANILEKESVQNKIRETAELKKTNAERQKEIVQGKAAADSYNTMAKRLAELGKQYRSVSQKDAKGLTAEMQKLEKELKKMDAAVGRHQRNVGNYSSALSGAVGMLKRFATTMGLVGGGMAVKKTLETTMNFEKSLSNLKAITGASSEELRRLEISAQRLGAITPRTATEVANLQTEFAKLGFTTTEILKATEATLALSIATGKDLAESANIAGSTLRAFGLDASETQRVVDVLAKSFSTSALDIDNVAEAMKYVAPVARAAGFTIEETSAMLAKLADSGIRGSMAGTALRRVFLEVAKAGGPPQEAFDALARSGITLAEANDEVGDRAQTALLVLADQKAEVERLTGVYNEASGAAQTMATTMEENLAGDITKMKSAWEGLVLSFKEGTSVIRSSVQGLTNFITNLRDTREGVRLFTEATGRNWVTLGSIFRDVFQNFDPLKNFIDSTGQRMKQLQESMDPEQIGSYINELQNVIDTNDQKRKIDRDVVDIAVLQITKLEEMLQKSKEQAIIDATNAEEKRKRELDALLLEEQKATQPAIAAKNAEELAAAEAELEKARAARESAVLRQAEARAKALDKEMQDAGKNATAQIAQAQATSDQLVAIEQQRVEKTEEAIAAEAEFRKGINRDIQADFAQSMQSTFEVAAQAISTISDIFAAQKERELNAAGDNAKKREEIERKYFKKEQALAISNVLISGATAIAKLWGQLGVGAPLLIPLLTATTAAQVAMIASQKFAEGGFTGKGAWRDETGERVAGIVHENEFVIDKKNTRKYRPILEAIHSDNPMALASAMNGQYYDMWERANYNIEMRQDPFTQKMYEIMSKQPVTYQDSYGNTVMKYPDGRMKVIKRINLN